MGFGSYETAWAWLHKLRVVVVAECKGKQIGRVRFKIISEASCDEQIPFIKDNIESGSTVITDGWKGYSSLSQKNQYKHIIKTISGSE